MATQLTTIWFLNVPQTHGVRVAAEGDSVKFEVAERATGLLNNIVGLLPFDWGPSIMREWRPINLTTGGTLLPSQIVRAPSSGAVRTFYDVFRTQAWNTEATGPLRAVCLQQPIAPPGCTVTEGFMQLGTSPDVLSLSPPTNTTSASDTQSFPFSLDDSYVFCVIIDTCHQASTLIVFRTSATDAFRGVLLCYQYHPGVLAYYQGGSGKIEQLRADDIPTVIVQVTGLLGVDFEPLRTISLPNALANFTGTQAAVRPYANWRKIVGSYIAGRDGIRVGYTGSNLGTILTRDGKPVAANEALWPRNLSGGNYLGYLVYTFILVPPGNYNFATTPAEASDFELCLPTQGI